MKKNKEKTYEQRAYEAYVERLTCNVYAEKITDPEEIARLKKNKRPWRGRILRPGDDFSDLLK